MKVVGYIRVSTDGQADHGVSLDAQRAKLEAYAIAMDLELVGIEVDAGISAKSLERPGLRCAMWRLESGEAAGLLVAKLDRLTRSVKDLGWLVEPQRFGSQWALLSVADSIDTRTAGGRLVLNVLVSVSQWEREAIGERTREALAHLKAEGVSIGGEALGWRRTGELDANGRKRVERVPEEEVTVERILDLRLKGYSLRQIAGILRDDGAKTKNGGQWHPQTVSRVLQRAELGAL